MFQMVIILLMSHVTVNNLTLNIRHSIVQKIYFEFASGFRTALKTIHFNRGRILKIVNNTISKFLTVMLQIGHKNCQKWTNTVARFLRMGARNLKIQDCKDVDALWRPTLDSDLENGYCYKPRTRTRKNFGHPCPFIFDQMCYEFQSFHGLKNGSVLF